MKVGEINPCGLVQEQMSNDLTKKKKKDQVPGCVSLKTQPIGSSLSVNLKVLSKPYVMSSAQFTAV